MDISFEEAYESMKAMQIDISSLENYIRTLEIKNKCVEALEKRVPKEEKNDTCPSCGTSSRFIIENLGNPKGHPVVYCWNCGQAISLTWETGEDERSIRNGG